MISRLLIKSKIRVTGPFTVEAVPSPTVQPISEFELPKATDDSIARTGETFDKRSGALNY